jgi:NRAMP (natural resistance-associated macrophage protein)-like metal ion transporter
MDKVKSDTNKNSIWKTLGPGLITGASDDDPSGIATYSQAGAAYGYGLLWTSLFTYPMMATLQEMCARIGLVSGKGLAGVVNEYYPRWVNYVVILFSFPAIILNIGADLAGMGAVCNMLMPSVSSHFFSLLFTLVLMYAIIFFSYRKLAMILKYLCLVLLCYCIVPFLGEIEWAKVAHSTFIPHVEWNEAYLLALVGILGTTISPYLFFWQTSTEVEELNDRQLIIDKQMISDMRFDVRAGIFFSNLVFYFIILTSGAVLFKAGIHDITTVEEAARALKPLAGESAYLLFTVGIVGTGMLAIPVLAGSLSYIMAETFNWTEGLNKKFHEAKKFYLVIILSLLVAFAINYLHISPVKALFFTAVAYGVTAPVLIALILHICNNEKVMGRHKNGKRSNGIAALTLISMSLAALLLLYSLC